jgi:GNAT superfamily N-acetyltransferase
LVGYVAHGDLWLEHLYVDPSFHRLGVGFRFVEATDGSHNEEREPDALFEWRRPA